MSEVLDLYVVQLEAALKQSIPKISIIRPSDWVEQNVVITDGAFPGPLRYSLTPYTREIIDCLDPAHPARWVAIMKGAQLGFSSTVLIPGIGWMMANSPGNSMLTVGNPDLIEPAMEKLDLMIDGAGLRALIKPKANRARANKSGDTNFKKDFPFGYVIVASANNHKAIRQLDLMYGFFDDFEAAKKASKESGNTRDLLEQRFAAYASKHKIFYISTPELKKQSNIEPAYLMGDQRKFMVPCQCCSTMIEIRWKITKGDITGGLVWDSYDDGRVVPKSVRYRCQECGGEFDDKNKHEMLNSGLWVPTATPRKPGFYSYHISSLYASADMYDWEHYVNKYVEANPQGQPRDEDKHKTFVNTALGETYEELAESPKANSIQGNTRPYKPGIVPDRLSISDGNGPIRLLTCSIDMNGKVDDARLDYEILAWSHNGTNYSVLQGSIGTFVPFESTKKVKEDRIRWTYESMKPNSVWPELDRLLSATYFTDDPAPLEFGIYKAGLDCGHFSMDYAYPYLDRTQNAVIGLKGDKESRLVSLSVDRRSFKPALERPNLYILQVNMLKDELSKYMQLRWDPRSDSSQPENFMNFPEPNDGLYSFQKYFEHFEAEQRVVVKLANGTAASRWEKKNSKAQNHFWDCRVYNLALRDIVVDEIVKATKLQKMTWRQVMDLLYPQN